MKTLIAYSSKYGTAAEAARRLADLLNGTTTLHDLDRDTPPSLSEYDSVVVGGSVYAGVLRKAAKAFCEGNSGTLQQKKLGLYVCCASPTDGLKYIEENLPAQLVAHCTAKGAFGGELKFDKMNFVERPLLKMIAKKMAEDHPGGGDPAIDDAAIQAFAAQMNE